MLLILKKKERKDKHEIKYFLSSSQCLDYCRNTGGSKGNIGLFISASDTDYAHSTTPPPCRPLDPPQHADLIPFIRVQLQEVAHFSLLSVWLRPRVHIGASSISNRDDFCENWFKLFHCGPHMKLLPAATNSPLTCWL